METSCMRARATHVNRALFDFPAICRTFQSRAEGIRTPDLRRANADRAMFQPVLTRPIMWLIYVVFDVFEKVAFLLRT